MTKSSSKIADANRKFSGQITFPFYVGLAIYRWVTEIQRAPTYQALRGAQTRTWQRAATETYHILVSTALKVDDNISSGQIWRMLPEMEGRQDVTVHRGTRKHNNNDGRRSNGFYEICNSTTTAVNHLNPDKQYSNSSLKTRPQWYILTNQYIGLVKYLIYQIIEPQSAHYWKNTRMVQCRHWIRGGLSSAAR